MTGTVDQDHLQIQLVGLGYKILPFLTKIETKLIQYIGIACPVYLILLYYMSGKPLKQSRVALA